MPHANVDAYLAAQPAPTRAVLQKVRAILRKALPGSEEVISYQIPAYKLHGRVVIFFAGWQQHYSIYPITDDAIAHFETELARAELSNKGTARFSLTEPIPAALLTRIAKFLATRTLERVNAKATRSTHTTKRAATKPVAKKRERATSKPHAKTKTRGKTRARAKTKARASAP